MAFSRTVIWRRPFVVVFLDQHTQAVLSLNNSIGEDDGMYKCLMLKSSRMVLKAKKFFYAFICCINFSFSGGSSGNLLTFGHPM